MPLFSNVTLFFYFIFFFYKFEVLRKCDFVLITFIALINKNIKLICELQKSAEKQVIIIEPTI
jgi:hypothetical protein